MRMRLEYSALNAERETDEFLRVLTRFRSLYKELKWKLMRVSYKNGDEPEFEIVAGEADELAILNAIESHRVLSFSELLDLIGNVKQFIWFAVVGFRGNNLEEPILTLNAVDSTFIELISEEEPILKLFSKSFAAEEIS